jgi:acyl-CoA synthetase (AMP-forming)/AMP-acid ligase II
MSLQRVNVADRLAVWAGSIPDSAAVACARPAGYAVCTFRELDDDALSLARGLLDLGVQSGDRLVLLVKPSVEFVTLVFALLRAGVVTVLVDPGMGRKHLLDCLSAAEPDGFIAISRAQAVRTLLRRRFPKARFNVTVGRRWFWGGVTYRRLLNRGRKRHAQLPTTYADDPAAIIFTSGSTGPPKGVLYTHGMFDTQAGEIQRAYDLQPGGIDLACFALFGLFNSAIGVTTVFPEMDFSRPAFADPKELLRAANEWRVTQAFASPAVWDKLSRHCEQSGERIDTLRKVFSCGAPVAAAVIERTLAMVCLDAEMHTPYGATEALPVATIEAREILNETAAMTSQGAGVCVGRKFDSIEWKIIRITDEPIADIGDAEELPPGEIGELIVRGPQVSPSYIITIQPRALPGGKFRSGNTLPLEDDPRPKAGATGAKAVSKIRDGAGVWHRMGDVGYFDDKQRFWYCGRKSQRVQTRNGPLFTGQIESVFETLPGVRRAALVGIGPEANQAPVMVLELKNEIPADNTAKDQMINDWYHIEPRLESLWHAPHGYTPLKSILFHPLLPVDVRHNSKINREQVAAWAAEQLNNDRGALSPRSVTGG